MTKHTTLLIMIFVSSASPKIKKEKKYENKTLLIHNIFEILHYFEFIGFHGMPV